MQFISLYPENNRDDRLCERFEKFERPKTCLLTVLRHGLAVGDQSTPRQTGQRVLYGTTVSCRQHTVVK